MYDFAIIGGGILGLSVGMALGKHYPDARIVIIEKEQGWAQHQTGRNSGVIHSGIYYKPGSLKAQLAHAGNTAMVAFCQEHDIRYEICGKLIVATEPEELPLLDHLYDRGIANGLGVQLLTQAEMREIEPHVQGLAGIRVPTAGIVDYKQVASTFARLIETRGGDIRLNTRVEHITEHNDGVALESNRDTIQARFLINCAGLQSDRVADMDGVPTGMKIIPFRGEYYELKPEKRYLVNHLVYPVPNPAFPFLGVHFTRMIDGNVHAGPNAVLSLKREGYRKTDFNLRDTVETLTYPAFWKLAWKHWDEGAKELVRSISKRAFVRSLQRLVPAVQSDDLIPSSAGVRAQALMHDGALVDDFLIIPSRNGVHVCNAPSPAATASIEIGKVVVQHIAAQYDAQRN